MGRKLSDKFRGFVFDESPDNGNEDVIKTLNLVVAQGNIEYQILLDDELGEPYFYECMRLAYNVIKSFEVEELEE